MASKPARFVARRVEIDAMPFTWATWPALNLWLAAELGTDRYTFRIAGDRITLHIETFEGVQTTVSGQRDAKPGAWIIKGTQGEFYPVTDEVFHAKYEPFVPSRHLSPVDGA